MADDNRAAAIAQLKETVARLLLKMEEGEGAYLSCPGQTRRECKDLRDSEAAARASLPETLYPVEYVQHTLNKPMGEFKPWQQPRSYI